MHLSWRVIIVRGLGKRKDLFFYVQLCKHHSHIKSIGCKAPAFSQSNRINNWTCGKDKNKFYMQLKYIVEVSNRHIRWRGLGKRKDLFFMFNCANTIVILNQLGVKPLLLVRAIGLTIGHVEKIRISSTCN
jgi:hypothetical protein